MQITFVLNGEETTLDANPETPLLDVLGQLSGLRATRFSCVGALCGACTMHLNEQPVRSCVLTMAEVEGKQVTTIEGLSAEGTHPLQDAWMEPQVPQCGYCRDGQVMTAAALLKASAQPTISEIRAAFAGNVCRCGTYTRILYAIQKVVRSTKKPTT